MCCQIFSIKPLPTSGTVSGKQRNLLKEALPLISCWGEKRWQLADFFGKVLSEAPHSHTSHSPRPERLPPSSSKAPQIQRGGSYCTAQSPHCPWNA